MPGKALGTLPIRSDFIRTQFYEVIDGDTKIEKARQFVQGDRSDT